MKTSIVIVGSMFFLFLSGTAPMGSSATPPPAPEKSKLVEMLQDPLLWAPNYAEAIGAIRALAQAGEAKAEILPRQIVGRQKYADPRQAQGVVTKANAALSAPSAPRIPLPGNDARVRPPQIAAIVSTDDRAVHVGTPDHPARYIAAKITIDQVIARFGKPDRVTVEVIDDGTERRPIELTLYHWANDAILVGTTDINANPRSVDRVVLDTNAVARVIFEER